MKPKGLVVLRRLLRWRILLRLALLALLALASLAIVWLAYTGIREREIARLQANADGRMRHLSALLLAPAERYSYLPNLLGNYRILNDALGAPRDVTRARGANHFLRQLNERTGTSLMYLLDLHGTTIAASNWDAADSLVGRNYAFRPYFTNALRDGEARFFAMGVTSRKPGYYLAYRVKERGTTLGVAVVKIDLHLPDLGDSSAEMLVTDAAGVAFLSSRPDWNYRPIWPVTAAAAAQLHRTRQYEGVLKPPLAPAAGRQLATGGQIVSLRGSDGATSAWLIVRRRIADSEWSANLLIPMARVEDIARVGALTAAAGIALLLMLAVLLAQWRSRARERVRSRRRLERAHRALELQNDELRLLSEELRRKAITDCLTGMANRAFFLDSATAMVGIAKRHGTPLSLLLIDADHFKRINDDFGHPAGDAVLRLLAAVLTAQTREGDVAARYGGEEFIVALPHTALRAAGELAERIRARIAAQPAPPGMAGLRITVSIGVAQYRPEEPDIGETICRADAALYAAKHAGRDCVRVDGVEPVATV
ncbi:sensor domain-containing diguanylate cyclase [Pseudoduganella chitinolytica]|uniref:diguanylate cyclase n=1 Tax=Pseudoduganella chitinolytica TaxID=34070 RepID=A0ABY8BBM5_9BURK|nr:sensor domain-containing diguanylate cyclase [Pseudoduganella chitinolytica]WEF32553.1 diguanylate cyclase [Pseudoduganella chitinolytica]